MICRGCEFWDKTSTGEGEWGECDFVRTAWYGEEPIHPETRAYVFVGNVDAANLRTRHDFGCVQFRRINQEGGGL